MNFKVAIFDTEMIERDGMAEALLSTFPENLGECDVSWAAEAESRIDAYDSGKLKASPAEEVFQRIEET